MNIEFGQYKNKSVQWVLLNDPNYLYWLFNQPYPPAKILNEAKKLNKVFNEIPFVEKCNGIGCNNTATRCSVMPGNYAQLYWWCPDCNASEIAVGRIDEVKYISTYREAVDFNKLQCGGTKHGYQTILKLFLKAKGLSVAKFNKLCIEPAQIQPLPSEPSCSLSEFFQ